MTDSTRSPLTLKLSGNRIEKPQLPGLFRPDARRGARPEAAQFLPEGYLRVVAAIDLSATARAVSAGARFDLALEPGQVLVLELPDGATLITSGERLRRDLEQVAPEAVAEDTVELDAVRPRGAVSRGIGESLGNLASKIFVLDRAVMADAIIDEAIERVRETAGDFLAGKLGEGANWDISYLATRALMWAIEKRLLEQPGLYRWVAAQKVESDLVAVNEHELAQDAAQGPLLVFIHGTASYTSGSFADLRSAASAARRDWDVLEDRYGGRIYGFEHRTFSESPIENALALARALPAGARVDLVTHSRGGIVGDLLCVDWSDARRTEQWIDHYGRFRTPENRDDTDLDDADARDRSDLRELAALLGKKRLVVGRYVRVAAPASGTLLMGSNVDLFLSSLLTLFGVVTTLQGSPFYLALRRIVLEVARNRSDPNRIPGLEPMLPGSAMSRLLRSATPTDSAQLGVIAGDIEGAHGLKRLVEILADWAIYERSDNDLIVDTASMATGVARPQNARRLFVQGPEVNHFNYFQNGDSRGALVDWLATPEGSGVPGFEPLGRGFAEPRDAPRRRTAARGNEAPQPVVIVLPGVMGTHLQVGKDRVWFDPIDLAAGGLEKIAYTRENLTRVKPEKLFEMFYGDLCEHLSQTHRVVPYPYDWRRPVQDAAQDLAKILRTALDETAAARLPVRILAHSMGGLVTRAMAAAEPDLWNTFIGRDGARFIMLGTPNQGSHLMVEMLLGKGESLRKLTMLDVRHDLQEVLDIVAGFRGALQLLPRKGFADAGTTPVKDYLTPAVWKDLRGKVFDFWFGDHKVGVPADDACEQARSVWDLPGLGGDAPEIPGGMPEKVIYVCGKAKNTPCGLEVVGGRVKMLGTPEGDGTVSWKSGQVGGIGSAYLMEALHGDLADTAAHFESIAELLNQGATSGLARGWPSAAARDTAPPLPIVYDAGPATVPTDEEMARLLLGGSARPAAARRAPPPALLRVACTAMDLRNASAPILVGHYEHDAISGAEAVIDRDVVCNELTIRKHLGLYPGAIGTATVVLVDQNDLEKQWDIQRGAVVTGLGEWGSLTAASLTEAVRTAALRYLLTKLEREGCVCVEGEGRRPPLDLGLCSLLLGYSSTANIAVADSLHAILRGVLEANRQFEQAQGKRRRARIVRLDIVERYLDTAITAAKALPAIAERLNRDAAQLGMRVEATTELRQEEGARLRLEVATRADYWPRLIVTDASAPGEGEPAKEPAASPRAAPPEKLKYVFLSQRARAETEMVQRQPGLLEALVRLSIHRQNYDRDLARTLFHLMVPLDFKEAARQTDSLSLVVDAKTANLPWELLCADQEPLVAKTALVRQLASVHWRPRVRSTVDKVALVVGNPSTAGFARAFPGSAGSADPPPLPGAEDEAKAVSLVLRGAGYQRVEAIGQDQRAIDVFNRLFNRPYRIIHIAGHGEFEVKGADGKARSGVLLSDGLLLTAAEVDQMEFVPDLVFLNCCHLGTIDGKPAIRGVEYNKLASSLAAQLIGMGVRAVVAAGWAVDDRAGQLFAEVFYRALVADGKSFGAAIHEARRETYAAFPATNTWGAFQAYGDHGFRIDPVRACDSAAGGGSRFAAPQELIDRLEQLREELARPGARKAALTLRALQRQVGALLARGPDSWAKRGDVQYAIGRVYADFGEEAFSMAAGQYLKAIEGEKEAGRVPIKAIEQLANLEARSRPLPGEAPGDTTTVKRALRRLLRLARVAAASGGKASTPERCALIGSTYKRLALRMLEKEPGSPGSGWEAVRRVLEKAHAAYRTGAGEPATAGFNPYCTLNQLMIEALVRDEVTPNLLEEAVALLRAGQQESRSYWDAMMMADAGLIAAMAEGGLDDSARAPSVIDSVVERYRQARESVLEDARSWNSVIEQIRMLAVFAEAAGRSVLSANLREIAARLQPGGDALAAAAVPDAPPPAPRRRSGAGKKPGAAPEAANADSPAEAAGRKRSGKPKRK